MAARSRRGRHQSIAQSLLGIMLLTVPLVYLATIVAAWWLLALTWPSLVALVVTLAVFAWSHLIGTRALAGVYCDRASSAAGAAPGVGGCHGARPAC